MLRGVLLVLGTLCLIGSYHFLRAGNGGAALYLLIGGLCLTAGILFERWRYEPPVDRGAGQWQPTGERFADPVSGKLVEVYYNPQTGERDYRESNGH